MTESLAQKVVMGDPFVELHDISFYRGSLAIFDRISLKIPRGKIVGIMGPSGCGKTTLLRFIGAQLQPDEGDVIVDGLNLRTITRNNLFLLRKKMGILFQSGALFSEMNVFENVAFPLKVHTDLPNDMISDVVLMKLQAVGLRGAKKLMPSELSGGMARRVALARAIALDPELIMYDEPFVGQDPISKGVLVKLISDLSDTSNVTSILVSHDLNEMISISDYLYLLADKHVIAQGTPSELLNSDDPRVKQFMQGKADGPVRFQYPAVDFKQELLRGAHDQTLI